MADISLLLGEIVCTSVRCLSPGYTPKVPGRPVYDRLATDPVLEYSMAPA
jgi:hypothetical protein